jgi:hypothetical protein
MTTLYETFITELKNKLKIKHIKFKKIFSLINNQNYEEIHKIIKDDYSIYTLIENIADERKKIAHNMENKLNDLLWLNERLTQFGEEPQPTKIKALKLLKKKVFINIYDLESEQYNKRTTYSILRKDLSKNCSRRFPLLIAKENITLKYFLISL